MLAGYRQSGLKYYGEIIVNGNLVQLKQLRQTVAYVRKEDLLIPYLTVEQYISLFSKLKYSKFSSASDRRKMVRSFKFFSLVQFCLYNLFK